MQFSCTQENLKTALALTSHIAARQGTLPILANVLIRAEAKVLTLAATNLEMAIVAQLRGLVAEDGALTVNARLLADVVNLLPRDRIDAKGSATEIELACRGSATKVRGMDASEFPLIPGVSQDHEAVLPAGVLRDGIGRVAFAVAGGSARPELCGVYVAFDGGSMKLVATDSYRLAEVTLPLTKSTVPKGTSIIVPSRTIQEILRILSVLQGVEGAEAVAITPTANQLLVTVGGLRITSRLVDGTYPDYTQIVPTSHTTRVVLSRDELQTTARAAALFARTGINDVHLTITPKTSTCAVRSENAQLGAHEATMEAADAAGEDVRTILNSRYLLEGLAAIAGDAVAVELTGAVAPVVLRPHGAADFLYIIMPIKQ